MYHDNIIYKKKSNDPQFLLGVAVVLFLGSYLMNLGTAHSVTFCNRCWAMPRTA
jgi:hypothetical protein